MKQHPNHCNHKDDEFYDHVEIADRGFGDLYFFYSKSHESWEYCFRTGPDGEYSSMPLKYVLRWNDDTHQQIIRYFIEFMNKRA